MLKIAAASLSQTPIAWTKNIENISRACEEARKHDADILCLPELCLTGYSCEDMFFSDWLPKEALEKLKLCLPLSKGLLLNIGLPIRFNNKLYNCNAILEDTKLKGFVAKQLLANGGVYYEPRWFESWPAGHLDQIEWEGHLYPIGEYSFDFKGQKIAMEICEDAWQEENRPGHRYAEQKVDIILNPSASHFALNKTLDRQKLVKTSSSKFNCIYVYANLLGNDSGRLVFDGEVIIAEKGDIKVRNKLLPFSDVNLLVYSGQKEELPPSESDNNYLFPKSVALALYDYLRKSKANGFVLSLSGGADSSSCALLVAHMVRRAMQDIGEKEFISQLPNISWQLPKDFYELPKEKIEKIIIHNLLTVVFQSSVNSSEKTFEAAKYLADSLGAKFYHWSIQEEVDSYTKKIEKTIGRTLNWEDDDLTLQNIQARSRSPIIWMLANLKNALLLTTSNRSEGDVGYATMDGDTSGSIAPIAGVAKSFLLQWLIWAEPNLNFPGLSKINQLKPTAELRPSHHEQTDESDLMPYSILHQIEILAIRDRLKPIDVYTKMQEKSKYSNKEMKDWVIKFFKLWSRNQWKRERIAPTFHIDDFNVDPKTWCRFPILSGGFEEELKDLENIS
ncbi:MAG: NAD(+) synthase [Cytophagales bacterium]